MSQHTPGPWTISQAQPGGCSLGDGLYVQHEDGRPIAFASSGNPADARLIAASPDLLTALEEAARWIELNAANRNFPRHGGILAMARAAVRKAGA